MGRGADGVGNLFCALERRFREHAEAEQAKNAPSQEVGAFFVGTTEVNRSAL
jgi:hypothetical protein